jgi:hypothetical protein
VQGESAAGREAVERSAASVTAHCQIVFALIEKNAGLLAAEQVRVPLHAMHADGHSPRNITEENLRLLRQTFLSAHR